MTELESARLRLIPCPAAVARETLERSLGVQVPGEWPSEELRPLLVRYGAELTRDASVLGWGPWLLVEPSERVLVGDAGFLGKPDGEGTVELGYAIMPRYRRRGYATEAARALTQWALGQPGAKRVVAGCERSNAASIRVLERVGFRLIGERGNELLWELPGGEAGRP